MPMLLIVTPCKSILVGGTGLKVLLSLHLLKITFFLNIKSLLQWVVVFSYHIHCTLYKLECMSIKSNNRSLRLSSSLQKKSMDIHTKCTFNYQYRSSTEMLMGVYSFIYIYAYNTDKKRE